MACYVLCCRNSLHKNKILWRHNDNYDVVTLKELSEHVVLLNILNIESISSYANSLKCWDFRTFLHYFCPNISILQEVQFLLAGSLKYVTYVPHREVFCIVS